MRRVLSLVLVASLIVVLLPASPALALAPDGVVIEVETTVGDEGGLGPFTASGPLVDSGAMCSAGVTQDVFLEVVEVPDRGLNIRVVKQFICSDGSGSFDIFMQVRYRWESGTRFNWYVLGGTGDYADLVGSGAGAGLAPMGDYDVHDVFRGRMHHTD